MGTEAVNAPSRIPQLLRRRDGIGVMALQASAANLVLRGVTLGSKFLLLFVLARYFTPADVGVYGLVAGSVAITIYVLGMDYYVFNTRELLARTGGERAALIRDQGVFHVLVYAIVLPALLLLFGARVLPWHLALWFYAIVVLEHLSQEVYRLLIVLSRPVVANLVLFVRAGAWAIPLAMLAVVRVEWRHVEWVLGAWAFGATISIAIAARALSEMNWHGALNTAVDWTGMRRTFVGALPFLFGSLSLRGIEYSDRFFIERFAGVSSVGVYTFYFSLANVVQTFVVASVIQLLYPQAVSAYQDGDAVGYGHTMRRMAAGAVGMSVAGALLVAIVANPVLRAVRPIYAAHLSALWLLLGSAVISVVAMVPSYALYVRRRDGTMLAANLFGVVTSIGV